MSTTVVADLHLPAAPALPAELRDYWRLAKPNVMKLVVFTGWVGMFLAPGDLHPLLAFCALLSLSAGAAACAAINNAYDVDIDARMRRTASRPTASGRISAANAFQLGIVLALLSVLVMGVALNWVAAGLLALTIGFYVFVYTMGLKRRTAHNIVIGGFAGALPPLVGWAAVTGGVAVLPAVLVAIIFLWTPPHFWALALYRTQDYAGVSVPMLPVVHGRAATLRGISGYTVLVVLASLVPVAMGDLGPVYLAAATGLGWLFLRDAARLVRADSDALALRLFKTSIVYLFALFGAMAVDRLIGWGMPWS